MPTKKSKKEMLVVVSKVKEYIKAKKCMTSGDLASALSDQVHNMLDRAAQRTRANKRSTVRPDDL